jgi:NAD(P)-dependent dehydrogenase (short-subunit alcohol dehydrogenase family)
MWQNEDMKFDIKDKIVLITGAGKGAGRALAESFAERGARVAANDISPINVEEVVEGITRRGGQARAYIEDVAKKVAVQALVNTIEDELGGIDILVNHASVDPRFALLDMDEWDWHRTLDVNLTGAFLMTQSVGRVMREKGKGVIFNIVESSTFTSDKEVAYHASMAALAALSDLAARELSPYNIRVFSISRSEDVVNVVLEKLETL